MEKTSKTIDSWLVEYLDWIQYKKATEAMREQGHLSKLDLEVESIDEALSSAFDWFVTDDGFSYWYSVFEECERIETIKNKQNGEKNETQNN